MTQITTPSKFKEQMEEYYRQSVADPSKAIDIGGDATMLLCKILNQSGYSEGIKIFLDILVLNENDKPKNNTAVWNDNDDSNW